MAEGVRLLSLSLSLARSPISSLLRLITHNYRSAIPTVSPHPAYYASPTAALLRISIQVREGEGGRTHVHRAIRYPLVGPSPHPVRRTTHDVRAPPTILPLTATPFTFLPTSLLPFVRCFHLFRFVRSLLPGLGPLRTSVASAGSARGTNPRRRAPRRSPITATAPATTARRAPRRSPITATAPATTARRAGRSPPRRPTACARPPCGDGRKAAETIGTGVAACAQCFPATGPTTA